MSKTTILLLLLLPVFAFSQSWIGRQRADILKTLSGNTAYTITENGKTIESRSKIAGDSTWRLSLGFDSTGQCNVEKHFTQCNDCRDRLADKILKKRKYRWLSINNNQYLSKFSMGLLMEIQFYTEKYFITFLPSGLNRQTYQSITKRKK